MCHYIFCLLRAELRVWKWIDCLGECVILTFLTVYKSQRGEITHAVNNWTEPRLPGRTHGTVPCMQRTILPLVGDKVYTDSCKVCITNFADRYAYKKTVDVIVV